MKYQKKPHTELIYINVKVNLLVNAFKIIMHFISKLVTVCFLDCADLLTTTKKVSKGTWPP